MYIVYIYKRLKWFVKQHQVLGVVLQTILDTLIQYDMYYYYIILLKIITIHIELLN